MAERTVEDMTPEERARAEAVRHAMVKCVAELYQVADAHGVQRCNIQQLTARMLLLAAATDGHAGCSMHTIGEVATHIVMAGLVEGVVTFDVDDREDNPEDERAVEEKLREVFAKARKKAGMH